MKHKKVWSVLVGFVLVAALGFTLAACDEEENIEGNGNETTGVAVTSVTLDKASATLDIGETLTLTATVLPEDATNKTVSWISSKESVATVSEGTVTAVSEGRATITATTDGKKATCVITVNAAEAEGTLVTDTQSLFEAVASAQDDDLIRLAEGTYAFDDNLYITSSVTLEGIGNVVIKKGDGEWATDSKGRTSLITVAADKVTIKNLTVQGAATIGSNYAHGINVYSSENVTIENVTAKDNDGVGILVNDSSVTLRNVATEQNGWGGVNVDTGEKTNATTSLTADESCSFGEPMQIYCDTEAMANEITVDLPADYVGQYVGTVDDIPVNRYIWTNASLGE